MINVVRNPWSGEVSYENEEIRNQVRLDFHKKCYLCERNPVSDYEIDHFYPQKFFSELKHCYYNLFFICGKCNKIRPKDINSETKKRGFKQY